VDVCSLAALGNIASCFKGGADFIVQYSSISEDVWAGRDGWKKRECPVGVREEFYPMIYILAGVLAF
jgi:hypothetical protein